MNHTNDCMFLFWLRELIYHNLFAADENSFITAKDTGNVS